MNQMTEIVPRVRTAYRDPFSLGSPTVMCLPVGLRITEMVGLMPYLPPDFLDAGEVRINGDLIPREKWRLTRPKPSSEAVAITVTFHAAIRGGGGEEGGKSGIALIGALVVTIAAAAVSGGALASLAPVTLSAFGATSTASLIAAGAVSIIGGLLLTALTPPPAGLSSAADPGTDRDKAGAASAGGNILEANGPIPRVIGTRKVFPPLAAEPYTYFDGDDEWVEAVYVLAGPHDMSDIRIDGSPILEAKDLTFEVREGWPDDAALNIAQQQTRTSPVQLELSTHKVKPDDQAIVVSTGAEDLPVWHGTAGKNSPDEILLHLMFASGLSKDGLVTDKLRVPLRLRIRKAGDANWINLPELHYENATLRQSRVTIKLIFQDGQNASIPSVPITAGFVEARKLSPAQTVSPATTAWTADGYFSSGSGDDYLTLGTEGSSKVLNVTLTDKAANIYLDTATFTPGIYEIEIKRGATFKNASYTASTYFYSGGVKDFFHWRDVSGDATIPETRLNVIDTLHLLRTVSVWDDAPIQATGFATIAIRARNRKIDRVSVVASGYVQDWDGSAWVTWVITSNPAPHYRDTLIGAFNADPVTEALIDNTSLTEWRTACASLGYTCDHISEGERIFDVQNILAGTGFAKRYNSELWGVIRDYDRSAEGPVQIFSPRNSKDFKWAKAFARLPDGLRINFQSEDEDYTPNQLIVYRDNKPGPLLEQVNYEGLPALADARTRAEFDLGQAKYRSTFYTLTAPAEAIVCRRGSLVGVNHDVLHNQAGFGRISAVAVSGPNVTGITLDGEVPVWNETSLEAVANLEGSLNMESLGRTTGIAIRRTDGTNSIHQLSNATGDADVLTLVTPVTNDTWAGGPFDAGAIPDIDLGCLVVVGNFGSEYKRLIVSAIDPGPDLTATLTMLDEAQELWA